jgi:hypothetical protein
VAVDREHRVGLYEFVDGVQLGSRDVTWADALQLADLLAAMWALRGRPAAERLAAASEAFFTVRAYLEAMERRLQRLRAGLADVVDGAPARAFVEE